KILLNAHELQATELVLPKNPDHLYPKKEMMEEMLPVVSSFKDSLKKSCLDEAYKKMHSELLKIDKKLKNQHIEALYVEAYQLNLIDIETYLILEKARVNKLEENYFSLKN